MERLERTFFDQSRRESRDRNEARNPTDDPQEEVKRKVVLIKDNGRTGADDRGRQPDRDMAFDNSNPYEVHAYFLLGFWCSDCGAELQLRSDAELPSDQWCAEAAGQARSSRWYVPPASSNGDMDIVTCYCPTCASKRGLLPSAIESAD
jgi:hypothetical protein